MVTLYDDTTDTIAGGNPDAMVLVLGNTANGVVAESVFFRDIAQLVIIGIKNIDTFTSTNPQETTGVFENLGDIVVGEGRQVRRVTRQHHFLARVEVENDKTL